MEDVEKGNLEVSIPMHLIPKGNNPRSSSSEQRSPRHARRNILKVTDRGDEMRNSKVVKLRGELTRQKASAKSNLNVCARSNNPRCKKSSTKKDSRRMKPRHNQFEVGECSETKDDSGRVIEEEESEVEETEELKKVSEQEMLRKMKRKSKGKEKEYQEVIPGTRVAKAFGKKDAKDKLQTALTVVEKKKKAKL